MTGQVRERFEGEGTGRLLCQGRKCVRREGDRQGNFGWIEVATNDESLCQLARSICL
jgi:hypothetical protein